MRLFTYVILPVGFLVLALVAFRVVLPACAALPIVGELFPSRCPGTNVAAADTSLRAERERRLALLAQISQLERELLALGNCPVQAELMCPPGRMPPPPNEVVLLIDASGSMSYGVNTPRPIDEELSRLTIIGGAMTPTQRARMKDLGNQAHLPRYGESRIAFTQSALNAMLDQVDLGPTRVGWFQSCGELSISEAMTDESAVRDRIGAVRLGGRTGLANAIERTAGTVTGGASADDPVNMVLISDGYDTCGGDPCAAARAAKAARPGMRINVIDLVGLPNLRCVADETGGFYKVKRPGGDLGELIQALRSAAQSTARACLPEPTEPDRSAIDPDRWRAQDLSLLEGCWQLDNDYSITNINNNDVYTVPEWEVCFDAGGRGRQKLVMSNGMLCRSAVTAKFLQSGELDIREGGDVPCTQRFRIFERKMICSLDQSNRADCLSETIRRPGRSRARFRR